MEISVANAELTLSDEHLLVSVNKISVLRDPPLVNEVFRLSPSCGAVFHLSISLHHTHTYPQMRYPGIAGCKNARAGTRQSRKQTLVKSSLGWEPWAVETVGGTVIDFCKGCSNEAGRREVTVVCGLFRPSSERDSKASSPKWQVLSMGHIHREEDS